MYYNMQPSGIPPINPWRFYTLREFACLAGLSAKEIKRAVRSENLPSRKINRRRRVRGYAIINFLEQRDGGEGARHE
jgi:hypothetical protein